LEVTGEAEKLAESSGAGPVQQTGSVQMNVQRTPTAAAMALGHIMMFHLLIRVSYTAFKRENEQVSEDRE